MIPGMACPMIYIESRLITWLSFYLEWAFDKSNIEVLLSKSSKVVAACLGPFSSF